MVNLYRRVLVNQYDDADLEENTDDAEEGQTTENQAAGADVSLKAHTGSGKAMKDSLNLNPKEMCIRDRYLYAQLEQHKKISDKRMQIYDFYNENLRFLAEEGKIQQPYVPEECTHNAHMYYIKAVSYTHLDVYKRQA